MSKYEYPPHIEAQVSRMVRAFFSRGTRIERTAREADLAGVDYVYRVNQRCPLGVRCRFDRPIYASRTDVTWRSTEPRKMRAGTYAPLALFFWFQKEILVTGRGLDVYRMQARIDWTPRAVHPNGDGTGWIEVTIPELREWGALLRSCDRDHWITEAEAIDADRRIATILAHWEPGASGPLF